MSNIIYLDNSATTKPCEAAVENINRCLTKVWGNPSSLHTMGMYAENELISARKAVAELISANSDEIYFTSGATEANNISILSAARKGKKQGNRIVTTAIEHHSVLDTVKSLENEGFEVIYLKPDNNGNLSQKNIYDAINSNTILVSMMLVNNEVGSILPISSARQAINSVCPRAVLHCDAVQAIGKMPINVKSLGVDLLSASAHKIHGPKGVGFLYKSKALHLPALMFGGGQEKGLRPGTESVPLIAGLAGAVKSLGNITQNLKSITELRNYALTRFKAFDYITVNSPHSGLPYIINISVNGYRSETLLHFLESRNIFVSSGSACAKGKGSYVLQQMSKSNDAIDSALRISFSRHSTKSDIDALLEALNDAVSKLKKR